MNKPSETVFEPSADQKPWLDDVVMFRHEEIASGKVKILSLAEARQLDMEELALEEKELTPSKSRKPTAG